MKIKIIGAGCPRCQSLYEMIKSLHEEGKIDKNSEIEYSKDVNELVKKGVMGSPAILIDGEVIKVGMPNGKEEIVKLLQKQ